MSEIRHITDKDQDFVTESEYVVQIPSVEIRTCVQVDRKWKDNKGVEHDSSYLQIKFLDDARDIVGTVKDPDVSHAQLYKRHTMGTFTLAVHVDDGYKGRTKLTVIDFTSEEEK